MCLTAPARVVAVEPGTAVVETDGRRRRASTAVIPDVRPGDWVLVGAGTILRRLDPAEAAELAATIQAAEARSAAAQPPTGGPTC